MHFPRYEKIWLAIGGGALAVFLIVLGIYGFGMGFNTPHDTQTVDAQTISQNPNFQPGVKQTGPNRYEVTIVARTFSFAPAVIQVPAGAEVTFRMTSADVVHGFEIPQTNVNVMVVPGQVTTITHTFEKPGNYLILCNEYCGTGHQLMQAQLQVQ
ncbi:MAG: cytochrome c oxidase subunit II [Firmicutes bacterium]|nr:cytochrome c oxidase subunit II [Bacillota bacterium]